jgi:hypothetical protein
VDTKKGIIMCGILFEEKLEVPCASQHINIILIMMRL